MRQLSAPPQRMSTSGGRGLLEMVLVTIGTSGLYFLATVVVFAAATAVSSTPVVATAVAMIVWVGTVVGSIKGTRLLCRLIRAAVSMVRWNVPALGSRSHRN